MSQLGKSDYNKIANIFKKAEQSRIEKCSDIVFKKHLPKPRKKTRQGRQTKQTNR